jgi:hypothetical protein
MRDMRGGSDVMSGIMPPTLPARALSTSPAIKVKAPQLAGYLDAWPDVGYVRHRDRYRKAAYSTFAPPRPRPRSRHRERGKPRYRHGRRLGHDHWLGALK